MDDDRELLERAARAAGYEVDIAALRAAFAAAQALVGEHEKLIELLRRQVERIQSDRDSLRAEVERLRVDAGRYRWLRARHWSDAEVCCVADPKDAVKLGHSCPSLEILDDLIDAAMREEGGGC